MTIELSTDRIPDPDKLTFWHDAMATTLVPVVVTPRDGRPYMGRITCDWLGYVQISIIEAGSGRTARSPRPIPGSAEDFLMLGVQGPGQTCVRQDGRTAQLREGELVLWVSHRPYVLDHPGRLSLRVHRLPLRVVGVPESELRRVTARVISPEGGVAAMLAPLLSTLADFAKVCPATVAERLAGNVTDFIATLVAELTYGGREVADEGRRAMVLRIRDYVNHNLGDPTLSPESIAAAHHISTRQLYKLFEGEGATISRWIQRRRLEECRRELARRSSSTQTVFAVARRWGFTDAAYFSRAFRAAYGITPRDWRSSRDAAPPESCRRWTGRST